MQDLPVKICKRLLQKQNWTVNLELKKIIYFYYISAEKIDKVQTKNIIKN